MFRAERSANADAAFDAFALAGVAHAEEGDRRPPSTLSAADRLNYTTAFDALRRGDLEAARAEEAQGLLPDGAVIDAEGRMWLALWGGNGVSAFAPDGRLVQQVVLEAPHTSCPSFGGADGQTLFCTSALQGMDAGQRAAFPAAGMTFAVPGVARGQAEHQILL